MSRDAKDDKAYELERSKAAALTLKTKMVKTFAGVLLLVVGVVIALTAIYRGAIAALDLGASLAFVGIGFWFLDREGASGLFAAGANFLPWKK